MLAKIGIVEWLSNKFLFLYYCYANYFSQIKKLSYTFFSFYFLMIYIFENVFFIHKSNHHALHTIEY